MGYFPGALAFHRDMFLDMPYVADLLAMCECRQLSVNESLRHVNAKRTSYDYRVNDQILKKQHKWSKLGERWDGPYAIKWVHVDGNVMVQLHAGVI